MAAPKNAPTKSVLITGAAKRVGRAIALELASHGWSVAVHYNSSEGDAEDTVAALHDKHVHAMALQADLSNEDHVQTLIERAYEGIGPLTALVNNASVFENDNIKTATRESWDKHMEANLRAPLVLSQQFAQQLPEGAEGAIVNLLDQRIFKPTPQFLSYGVSRAGLHWLTTVLAQALAPRVRVNAVAPGPTIRNPRQSEAHFRKQTEATPLGRGATPEEVANAVRYLIDARAITGATLPVDGGQHLIWKTADVVGTEP
jgi:NAD(P)-dependent dehydrogenase (short-subunit alcohol dehydrogenase family)